MTTYSAKKDRRSLMGVVIGGALGLSALAAKTSMAQIEPASGAAGAGMFSAIKAELIAIGAFLKNLKAEYYDQHIKAFNAQARDINESLDNARGIHSFAQNIWKFGEALKKERDYANHFLKTFIEGDSFKNLRIKTYNMRVSALAYLIRSVSGLTQELTDLERDLEKLSGLPPEKKKEVTVRKRLFSVISASRVAGGESEIKRELIKERERELNETLNDSKMDESAKREVVNFSNLQSIKDYMDESIRLQRINNDLLEALLMHQVTGDINSRFGEKYFGREDALKARVDDMSNGKWSDN